MCPSLPSWGLLAFWREEYPKKEITLEPYYCTSHFGVLRENKGGRKGGSEREAERETETDLSDSSWVTVQETEPSREKREAFM